MTTILSWILLAAFLAAAAYRIPPTVKGNWPEIFWTFLLFGISIGLSIGPIYLWIDHLLGERNFTNLLLRVALYGAFLSVGMALSKGLIAERAMPWIAGWPGLLILGAIIVATIVAFLASNLQGSSPGLIAFDDVDSVQWYAMFGRLYPGYIAAILLHPAISGGLLLTNRPLVRIACSLIAVSLAGAVLLTLLQLSQAAGKLFDDIITPLVYWVSFLSLGTFIVGASLLTISRVSSRSKHIQPATIK